MTVLISEFISGSDVETENLDGLSFAYEEFLGIKFKLVNSCDTFTYDKEYDVWRDRSEDTAYMRQLVADGEDLTIVGVVQPKKEYGTGVLKPGIDYPFALVEKTIEDAASSEIVTAQLENPDVNIFTGTPFDNSGTARELDPASLVNVDVHMLKDAILIDQELLQTYFLNGADLSSVQISVPEMDASDLPDISNIAVLVRNQLIADLPALLSEIQFSSDDLFDLVEEILSDYICYLKESGYLEMGQLADYLREYFSSEAFSSVVRGWLDTLDPENRDETYLTGKIDELSDLILQSLNSYLNAQGLPGLPF